MTGRELIKKLEKHSNLDLPITISVDYNPSYPFRRVFAEDFLEIIDNDKNRIMLLFSGYSNNDMEME